MRAWVSVISALYLLLLSAGIFCFSLQKFPRLRFVREILQTISGAGGSWGFFSPDVGNQLQIQFETDSGRRLRLHELTSFEVALRIGNMYRLFVQSFANEKLKRAVAAALSSQIFRRFPEAKTVTMIASIYRFPSLAEYRKGERPKWKEAYRATFTTSKKETGAH